MKSISVIRKITERGQVTLPRSIRALNAFRGVSAVEFTERGGVVVVLPVKSAISGENGEYRAILDRTLSDWSLPEHDDLFDFS